MQNHVKTLEDVAAERWRIPMWLTGIMMFIYFGFILLIAFNKSFLATIVTPGLSLGILLGSLTIIAVWVLTYIYVNWANNVYDVNVAKLQAGLRDSNSDFVDDLSPIAESTMTEFDFGSDAESEITAPSVNDSILETGDSPTAPADATDDTTDKAGDS